jgi:hypothetical protein
MRREVQTQLGLFEVQIRDYRNYRDEMRFSESRWRTAAEEEALSIYECYEAMRKEERERERRRRRRGRSDLV